MSLDKFFREDKKKSDGKKAEEGNKKAGIRDIPDGKVVNGELTRSTEIISKKTAVKTPATDKAVEEPAMTIPGLEHEWEPDWLESATKEELYYILKETVEADRKFHHLKSYIEKQMVSKGSLDSKEMAIRLNLTEGEILILFDSIYATRKSKSGR